MFVKSPANPIIVADKSLWWANKKIYNAAAFLKNGRYNLVFRAIGDDYISRLGLATSSDGIHFHLQDTPIFEPEISLERKGCEDPRITLIGDTYWMAYTAFDGVAARVALTSTKDFISWTERRILFPYWAETKKGISDDFVWNKAAALFPEKINGKYMLLFGDNKIWAAESDDLINWLPSKQPVLDSRKSFFDSSYVEMGPPPIRIDAGWLILYHGISGHGNSQVYRLGAVIADFKDPKKILWRCKEPILEPTKFFEKVGKIDIILGGMVTLSRLSDDDLIKLSEHRKLPQAIFCCGAIKNGNIIEMYYSGSDTVLCQASGSINEICNQYS